MDKIIPTNPKDITSAVKAMSDGNYERDAEEATAETINDASKVMFGQDYSRLTKNQKLTIATELSTTIFITRYKELRENLGEVKVFFVDPLKFGAGYRQIMVDLLKVENYADKGVENWWPSEPVVPRDKEVQITTKLQTRVRRDIGQEHYYKYFKNADDLAKYINMQVDAAQDAIKVYFQQFLFNIFATKDEKEWTVTKDNDDIIKNSNDAIDMVRSAFKNKVTVEYSGDTNREKYTEMVRSIDYDIKLAIEKVNLKNSVGSVDDPFHMKPSESSLILLMNPTTLTDIDIDVKASLFNAKFLDLPNVKLVTMSCIDKDAYYLMDEEFLQLSTNLREFVTLPKNHLTLWILGAFHEWFYIGVNKYVYGKYVTMKKKEGEKTPEKMTNEELYQLVINLMRNKKSNDETKENTKKDDKK